MGIGVLDHLQPPFRHTIAIGMVWTPRLGGEGGNLDNLALERGQLAAGCQSQSADSVGESAWFGEDPKNQREQPIIYLER